MLIVASTLAILAVALAIPVASMVASSSAAGLNQVQVTVQASQNLPYQYTLTAYNSSGVQVANFYGTYPEAAFGLPSGTYLITAAANYYQSYYCNLCPLAGAANTSMPIRYEPPSSEYGYAVVDVAGPVQISIATKNVTDLPLVDLPVHVSFFNGTAAAGASVSAYVVGMGYSYSPNMVSYGQTGADGNFTLVMPDAPIQVSAYLSVQVQLPKNVDVVVPVDVGGQTVNVTVYWQPTYVGLYGQALILPPQKGADIVLKVQQNSYPIYYSTPGQGGVATVTTVSSGTVGPGGQSANIAAFDPSGSQLSAPGQGVTNIAPSPYAPLPLMLAVGFGAALVVLVAVLGRSRRTVKSARP